MKLGLLVVCMLSVPSGGFAAEGGAHTERYVVHAFSEYDAVTPASIVSPPVAVDQDSVAVVSKSEGRYYQVLSNLFGGIKGTWQTRTPGPVDNAGKVMVGNHLAVLSGKTSDKCWSDDGSIDIQSEDGKVKDKYSLIEKPGENICLFKPMAIGKDVIAVSFTGDRNGIKFIRIDKEN